jgi:alkylation response protein AidB-like acyl-CoA dehydrogenase
MSFELRPVSPAGNRLVELAEKHAAEFAATADDYDRRSEFPVPHWDSMRRSGLLAASVPAELGGLGVGTVSDLVAAVNRLARGDSSIAIGAAMHLAAFWYFSRLAVAPVPAGVDGKMFAALLRLLLRRCARGHAVACVAISEPGTSLGWPRTIARPDGDGYRVEGRKTFCTGSPVATVFLSTVRVATPDGTQRLGFAVIPREATGLTVLDNWDALGMRASGSNDVLFQSCPVPAGTVTVAGALGSLPTAMLPLPMVGALMLVGAALGIAERAQELIAPPAGATPATPAGSRPTGWPAHPTARALLAENEIDLAIGRAMLGRVAALLDENLAPGAADLPRDRLHELMTEVQCANVAVKKAAISIVDRTLTMSGGRGYLNANPLSRLYRDVRAGPFMQPFSGIHVLEYIARVRLGWNTELDDEPEGGSNERGRDDR